MIEKFLEYLQHEKRFSPHTLQSYSVDLQQFFEFVQKTDDVVGDCNINHLQIRGWIVSLLEAGIAPRSINRKLSALKSYFKFLRAHGLMTGNPMLKIVAPKTGKRLPLYVSESGMEQLKWDEESGHSFRNKRDQCIVELLYGTGIRESELIQLKVSDIDHSARSIKVMGKGRKERIVPLMPDLYSLLSDYLKLRSFNADISSSRHELFLTDKSAIMYPKLVYNIVRRHLNRVTTIEQRSPHVLRHTFATHLSDNGADIKAVKELLGHASLAATQVYTHNSIERLRKVYEQAFPRSDEK